jgi:hypothetical protein
VVLGLASALIIPKHKFKPLLTDFSDHNMGTTTLQYNWGKYKLNTVACVPTKSICPITYFVD